MKQQNFTKGRKGEEIAAGFLRDKGFEIIEQNWHTKFGEIDIVAKKEDVLVFVEVKLKVGEQYGTPEEMINRRKIAQITNTAEMYLLRSKKYSQMRRRIDAVCIVLNTKNEVERVVHYENI